MAFLVLALITGSVALPASANHGGAVVAKSKSKCKKKAKRAAAAKKKKCKKGGAGGTATSLPGQATHPTVTPPVTTPAVHMSGLTLTDNPILGSRSTQGKVTISGAAPSAGQPVTLASTSPRVSVPGADNVAAGQKTATYHVTTSTGPTITAGVKASIGTSSKQVFLKVVQEPSVKSVSLAYKCFPDVGLLSFGTNRVTLDVPADADSSVGLLSSNESALTVPSAVTVPAGSSSAIFGVNTLAVLSPPGVTVTGSLMGALGKTEATSAPSSIRDDSSDPPVVVGISATSTNVAPNSSVTGKVTLNCEAPSPDGTTVTLVSNNPSEVTVPPNVVVPADALSVTFPITAAVGATGTATITATPDDGTPKPVTVTVTTLLPT
jgi:hypothetical protein